VFLLVVLICLSPFKPLAYVVPFLAICWLYIGSENYELKKRVIYICGATFIALMLSYILFRNYRLIGGLFAAITYGTFLLLAAVPAKCLGDRALLEKMTEFIRKVLLFEAIVGIIQGLVAAYESGSFDVANGDVVEGTIHLSFSPDDAFGNPMFAANLCFMLIALLPGFVAKKRPVYIPVALGIVAFVLASVMHMIVFLALSLIFALCVFRPPIPVRIGKRRLIGMALVAPVLTLVLLSGNLGTLPYFAAGFLAGELPKGEMVRRAIFDMPAENPTMPIIGLGAGQFSSRASLITTGLYFGGLENPRDMPFLQAQLSNSVEDYLYDLWVASSESGAFGGGSSVRPFFSWLSVYTEFGAVVFLGLCVYGLVLLIRLRRSARSGMQKWQAVSAGAGIMFCFLIGFQENYWEVPQAILIGLMLVQVTYANVVHGVREV
jgi:hypothetical protein